MDFSLFDKTMTFEIQHDRTAQHFSVDVDGHLCVLEYRLADAVMTIVHTDVPEAVGGRGIAGALVRAALVAARAEHWRVVPVCSYAAAFMAKHPEYADLLN